MSSGDAKSECGRRGSAGSTSTISSIEAQKYVDSLSTYSGAYSEAYSGVSRSELSSNTSDSSVKFYEYKVSHVGDVNQTFHVTQIFQPENQSCNKPLDDNKKSHVSRAWSCVKKRKIWILICICSMAIGLSVGIFIGV